MKEEAAEPKTLEHLLRRHGELLAARDWLRTLTNDLSPASIPGYRTDGTSESILRMADLLCSWSSFARSCVAINSNLCTVCFFFLLLARAAAFPIMQGGCVVLTVVLSREECSAKRETAILRMHTAVVWSCIFIETHTGVILNQPQNVPQYSKNHVVYPSKCSSSVGRMR